MHRLAVLAILFVTPGCAFFAGLFAIGGGVYADRKYQEGIGVQDFHASIERTWAACRAELDAEGVEYNKEFKFNFEKGSEVEVKGGWIEIRPHPNNDDYTRVRARFPNEGSREKGRERADTLLDGINTRLGGAGDAET